MSTDRLRVVTWLHLADREDYGDYYEDGSPVGHTREVWKSVEIGPWCYGPETLSHSVPITEPEAMELLQTQGSQFDNAIYSKLGIRDRSAKIGVPKGPYYDPLDHQQIYEALRQSLSQLNTQYDTKLDRRGESVRTEISRTLGSRLVESIRIQLKHDKEALNRLSSESFRQLIAELLRGLGYDVHDTTQLDTQSNTILAYRSLPLVGPLLFVVECAHRDSSEVIRVGEVRRFVANSMQPYAADRGIFVTTSCFVSELRRHEEQWRKHVKLYEHSDVRDWIEQYGSWEKTVDGELWTPYRNAIRASALPGHLFLSYSRNDYDIMQALKIRMLEVGVPVWTDERIEIGTSSWKDAIQEAIREASALVCILSPHAAQSRWVQEELYWAEKLRIPIFLLLADGDETSSVPFGYSAHQYLDIRDRSLLDQKIPELTSAVQKRIGFSK